MISNTEFADRNDAIARHLGGILPATSTVTANTNGGRRTLAPSEAGQEDAEIVHVLQHLLQKYVALLESSEHGGWSLDEDMTVRMVCALLASRAA
jgi:hypothetical protein